MMQILGNKKMVKMVSFGLAGVFIVSTAAMALMATGDTASAAPSSNIGVVDQQQVISANPNIGTEYQQKMQELAQSMQKDFDTKTAGMTDEEKQPIYMEMQQQFNEKRIAIEKEMQERVNTAVKSVAEKKGLSLVVEKSAVIYGGVDITKDVTTSMTKATTDSAAKTTDTKAASTEKK